MDCLTYQPLFLVRTVNTYHPWILAFFLLSCVILPLFLRFFHDPSNSPVLLYMLFFFVGKGDGVYGTAPLHVFDSLGYNQFKYVGSVLNSLTERRWPSPS